MTTASRPIVTIRCAESADAFALRRLAELDSSATPTGDVLIAEVGGEPRAALSRTSGAVVADPFHRTAGLVELLQATARAEAAEVPVPRREIRGMAMLVARAAAHRPRLAGA